MRWLSGILVLTATTGLGVVAAHAGVTFTITPIVVEGDSAGSVGRVTLIDNVAVNNSGAWLVEADTDFANTDQDQVLLRNGSLYLREDDALPLPLGSRLNTFDSITLNNLGDSGWNFFLAGTSGTTDDSGVYLNTTLLLQEGTLSSAPGFSPGTPYIGFFDVKINNSNQSLVVASIDDPAIATTVDRALVIFDHTGGTLVSETVRAKEGDVLPGQTEAVADFGTAPEQSALNDAGSVLYFADLTGDTTRDGCIYLDLTLLAQEGSPSPVPARNYEFLSSRGLDLNNNGDYVFKANLLGTTTDDEMIVKNGAEFIREGGSLPVIAPYRFTSFGTTSGPVKIDDRGNVLWFGDWDDPNTDKDTALFLNDRVIISEGDAIGTMVLDEIASGEDAFEISDDGRWIIFEGTLVGGLNSAFLVEVLHSVPVAALILEAGRDAGGVRLHWSLSEIEHLDALVVTRGEGGAEPQVVAAWTGAEATPEGSWLDTGALPGTTYRYRITAHAGGARVVSDEVTIATVPALRTALLANVPNPFNPSTELRFALADAARARLAVFDARGRAVRRFDLGPMPAGEHAAAWDGRDGDGRMLASGVYYVRLEAGAYVSERPVTLVR